MISMLLEDLVTAKHPEAPPILQWDSPDKRNPVSLYVYVNGSATADWNLRADDMARDVEPLAPRPADRVHPRGREEPWRA